MEIIPIQVPFPKGYGDGDDTNAYLLKCQHPVLIDTGVDSRENREYLKRMLQAAGAWGPEKILVTHGHHDHFGLAAFVQAETGAEVLISESDSAAFKNYGAYSLKWFEEIYELGVEGGYDRQELEDVRLMLTVEADFIQKPRRYTAFKEISMEIDGKHLRALGLPGHTAGITGFAIDDMVFCGDVVIEGRANVTNLEDELSSLAKLKGYRQIFPGHRRSPLSGNEMDGIEAYLMDRCRKTLGLVEGGKRIREVVDGLYGRIDDRNFIKRLMPLKQTIAYLRFLEGRGKVVRRYGRWWSVDQPGAGRM